MENNQNQRKYPALKSFFLVLEDFFLFAFVLPLLNGTFILFTIFLGRLELGEKGFFSALIYLFTLALGAMIPALLGILMFGCYLVPNAIFLTLCACLTRGKFLLPIIAAVDSILVFYFLNPVFWELDKESWKLIFAVPLLSFAATYFVKNRRVGCDTEEKVRPFGRKRILTTIAVILCYTLTASVVGGVVIGGAEGFCSWRGLSIFPPQPFDIPDTWRRIEMGIVFETYRIFSHGFYLFPVFYVIQFAGVKFDFLRKRHFLFMSHVLAGFIIFHLVIADMFTFFTGYYWRLLGPLVSVAGIVSGTSVFLLHIHRRRILARCEKYREGIWRWFS
jgi:hypothetical protein